MSTRKKPSLDDFRNKAQYNPTNEIPDDLKRNIVLCDDLPSEDKFRDELQSVPVNDLFPEFDCGYDENFYAGSEDKKALNNKQITELFRIDELSKRKNRCKMFKEIYDELRQKHEEERQTIQDALKQSQNEKKDLNKEKTKKILASSRLDSNSNSDSDDSEAYSADEDDIASSSVTSDDDAPIIETKRPKMSKSTKKSQKEAKKPPRHAIDSETQFQFIKDGKVTSVGFISDVYKKEKDNLEELQILMEDNPNDDDITAKIQEQEMRVQFLQNKLTELRRIPDEVVIAPKSDSQNESYKHHDSYQRLKEKAQKEMEQDKMTKPQAEKLTTASRASVIDQTVKDLFGDSDDSESDLDLK